jgi:AcrR family transcriptional regulator
LSVHASASRQGKFKAGADLRRRLLVTANHLFQEHGYENISIRSIAREVGCSQMAMYRHFPDKDALIRHLCTELYRQFTASTRSRFQNLTDPKERLRRSLQYFLLLAIKNPNHYRFTFLSFTTDEKALRIRSEVAAPAIAYLRSNLRLALPESSPEQLIGQRLQELLAIVHGLAVMLITYPKVYKLTRETALKRMDDALELFLETPDRGKPRSRNI